MQSDLLHNTDGKSGKVDYAVQLTRIALSNPQTIETRAEIDMQLSDITFCMGEMRMVLADIAICVSELKSNVARVLIGHDRLAFTATHRDSLGDIDMLASNMMTSDPAIGVKYLPADLQYAWKLGGKSKPSMKEIKYQRIELLKRDKDWRTPHSQAWRASVLQLGLDKQQYKCMFDFKQSSNNVAHQPPTLKEDGLSTLTALSGYNDNYIKTVLPENAQRECLSLLTRLYRDGNLPTTGSKSAALDRRMKESLGRGSRFSNSGPSW